MRNGSRRTSNKIKYVGGKEKTQMKKSVMVIVIAACLSGCTTVHKLEAIKLVVEADRVQGLKTYTNS
jgi:hypothetical protein